MLLVTAGCHENESADGRKGIIPKLWGVLKDLNGAPEQISSPNCPVCSCACVATPSQSTSPYKLMVVPNRQPQAAAYRVAEPSYETPSAAYHVKESSYVVTGDGDGDSPLPSYVLPPAFPFF